MEYLIDDLLCPRGFWPLGSTVQSWSSQHEIARFSTAESTIATRAPDTGGSHLSRPSARSSKWIE